MKTALIVLGVFIASVATGAYTSYERRQQLAQPVNPALQPGRICDEVAAQTESKPTVGWYHACINYAAEFEAKHD